MSPIAHPDCIIVADSEVLIRTALSDYLRECGYKVIDAASSDEVVEILTDPTIQANAILCDAELSGAMNPFALRFWTREKHPGITFILAGNIDASAKAASQLCDEGPHLRRPYDPQLVVNRIKQLLAPARK